MSRSISPFAEEFAAFARADKLRPPPPRPVLFYGSSSFRLWENLGADFPDVPVLSRAFGGSTLAECVQELERLVFPYEPRALILYAGDNDLDDGAAPDTVLHHFEEFERRVRARLGGVPIAFVSVKPSPARERNLANIRKTNALVREQIAGRERTRFLDIYPQMLDAGGRPRRDLFTEDSLHMNAAGYRIWREVIGSYLNEPGVLE